MSQCLAESTFWLSTTVLYQMTCHLLYTKKITNNCNLWVYFNDTQKNGSIVSGIHDTEGFLQIYGNYLNFPD